MEHLDNERIQHYLDGALEEKERVRVEEHLTRCLSCAQELKAWEKVFAPLNALPWLEPGRHFEADVLGQLGIQPWWAKLFARPLWPKAALAGAMATLAVWLGYLTRYLPDLTAPQNAMLATLPAKASRGASGAFFAIVHALGDIPAMLQDLAFYLKIGNTVWTGVNQPAVWGALFVLMALTLYLFRMASVSGRAERFAGLSILNLRLYQ
jgi:anti-sigma factor RsiW